MVSSIREFTDGDAEQVSRLNELVFVDDPTPPPDFFVDVFLGNPWYDPQMPSLVCAETDGRIVGFLGVVPRTLENGTLSGRAAIVSQFMVDPGSRSSMAGIKMLKAHLSGPQLLSVADAANDAGRALWVALGGEVVPSYSYTWNRQSPFMPASNFISRLSRPRGSRRVGRALQPLADKIDFLFDPERYPWGRESGAKNVSIVEASVSDMIGSSRGDGGRITTFSYDVDSFTWLLSHARQSHSLNRDVAVRGVYENGERLVGFLIYVENHARDLRLLHMYAAAGKSNLVLGAFMVCAREERAKSIGGRLDPELNVRFARYSDMWYTHRQLWGTVYCKDERLAGMIRSGSLTLSQLECEWSCNYRA